ncbi:hypothetical protein A3K63_03760 [Candidatus Micrarchaeota archaeon RBG_16_49_10]|nr:MAG: hypothetical protein A3K63_03760 [Candidatus Micrarchaeota archaeon RBG_16_49_10]
MKKVLFMNRNILAISSLVFLIVLFNLPFHDVSAVGINVTANSGSPADVQTAVDQVASAGGGTVYVPAGNWTFDETVTVYGGVNLVGAGMNRTRLIQTREHHLTFMIFVDGRYNALGQMVTKDTQKPVMIKGMSLIGFVPSRGDAEDTAANGGLGIRAVKDFLVYDMYFEDFAQTAIGVDENDGHSPPRFWSRGVISHSVFDNPYKYNFAINGRIWGYGIIVSGSSLATDSPLASETWGKYETVPFPGNIVYIEDNSFRRNRHSIASTVNFGAHFVARHNVFRELYQAGYGSLIDTHAGDTHNSVEVYDNLLIGDPVSQGTIYQPPENYIGQYLDRGILLRGGSGLIYNNDIRDTPRVGVGLQVDFADKPELSPKYVWIWNNQITYPNSGSGTDILTAGLPNVYLRAPNQAQDGFTYTPYVYPHPLTLSETPSQPSHPINLTGAVTDSSTGLAIAGASVVCNAYSATTNATGGYKLTFSSTVACSLTASKSGYVSKSTSVSYSSNGTYIQNFALESIAITRTISGNLMNKNNQSLSATIVVYSAGTTTIANSTQASGSYELTVSPGMYDVQFNFSGRSVKLLSVSVASDVSDLINHVNTTASVLSFVSSRDSQQFKIAGPSPTRVLINNSVISMNTSLADNTYYYLNGIVYLKVAPGLKSDCLFDCCSGETRYREKDCPSSQYCSSRACVAKLACSYECCINEEQYSDKSCTSGTCSDHECGAQVIFSDDFEGGSFSKWTVRYAPNYNRIVSSPVHSGVRSAELDVTTANNAISKTGLIPSPEGFIRSYVRFNGSIPSGALVYLMSVDIAGFVIVRNNSGQMQWGLLSNLDGGYFWTNAAINTNTWHLLEMRNKKGSTTGEIQLFVDGSSVLNQAGRNMGSSNFTSAQILAQGSSSIATKAYFDDVVFSNSYIGP